MRALAASAYRHGAKFVDVGWFDPHVKRARIEHARPETLDFVPPWYGERVLALGEQRAARVALSGPTAPGLLADLDPVARRARTGCRPSRRASRSSTTARRTGRSAPCPTPAWAELVFPDLEPAASGWSGSSASCCTSCGSTRTTRSPPGARAPTRSSARAERLTERRFDALHYEGPGTDLTIGLLPSSGWQRGALPDRRRDRAHAEPPDRGGLHDARPRAHRGHGHLDEAARADRRHRRARPRRPLRGRPRRRADGVRGRRDARDDHRHRRRRRAPRRVSRSSTARAGSASSGRSSTTRCSTRTRRATSRSARASRSCSTSDDRERCNESEIHIDFMIGSNELTVTGITPDGRPRPRAGEGRWQI